MPSSTSSFKSYRLASAALLGGLALIAVALELAAGTFGIRSSKVLTRIATEHSALQGFTSTEAHPRTSVILGNSLLLEGVDYPTMREELRTAGWDSRRFVVEQTAYYDWKYGLRRLAREGCRPDVMVLILTPTQLALAGYAGPSFAYNLMLPRDTVAAAREIKIHPTEAANLFLASESNFFGLRFEFRKFLLLSIIPGMVDLAARFTPPTTPMTRAYLRTQISTRIPELAALAAADNERLVVVIPPVANPIDFAEDVMEAGRNAGLPVVQPIKSGELPETMFRDGFHLNAAGAALFTKQLTATLLREFNVIKP